MAAEDGPSDAEEEKKAKRYRSASTTPRSTTGTMPHEYDMVMGIAPVEPQESVGFEEGLDSEIQDVVETAVKQTITESLATDENPQPGEEVGPGEFHGGYGNASLRECLERIVPQETTTPATLHSGVGVGVISSMTDPPQAPCVLQSKFPLSLRFREVYSEMPLRVAGFDLVGHQPPWKLQKETFLAWGGFAVWSSQTLPKKTAGTS